MTSIAESAQPFVCGGLSACIASAMIHPIDLVKVRIQLLGQGTKSAVSNPFTIATSIVKTEGVRGLYSGLSAALTRQATYGTARIGLHRVISQKLKAYNGDNGSKTIPFWQKAVSGMASGAIAVCVGTPFDVALVRMQNDGSLPAAERRNYRGVSDAITRIFREEGVKQLWSGLAPNILRGMSMNLGMMACYDQAKQMIVSVTNAPDSLTTQLGAAAAAGFCCAVFSLPFDMIKSRLQSMKANPITGEMPYKGVYDCATQILRNEGPLAFFRGFAAYYGRCAPHAMIILMSIEQITALYRSVLLPQKAGQRDHEAMVLSAKVIGTYADEKTFFDLQKTNKELKEEIERLRKELQGKEFKVGTRVVATGDSAWHHYKQGYTGVIVSVDKHQDPMVHWDHSGKVLQTSKLKISASRKLQLQDGTTLNYKAIGLRVKACADSGWGHYKKGDLGVIVGLNPTDPVVRWDNGTTELQTSRHKLVSLDPPPMPKEKVNVGDKGAATATAANTNTATEE